jgi:hypothetical protein
MCFEKLKDMVSDIRINLKRIYAHNSSHCCVGYMQLYIDLLKLNILALLLLKILIRAFDLEIQN